MKFQGLYTAIVTPFAGNRVDEEAFRMLVEAQIAAGVAGIEPDRNSPSGISVCFPVSIGFFRLCGCVVFMWERRSPYSPGIYRGQWKESCLAARQAAGIIPVPV